MHTLLRVPGGANEVTGATVEEPAGKFVDTPVSSDRSSQVEVHLENLLGVFKYQINSLVHSKS